MAAQSLANHVRELDAGDLRSVVHYEGDDYDVVFQREDLAEEYAESEFEEVAKHLVLKGFDDPLDQPEFARFGHLDATVRWFHDVVVIQVPLDEWCGVIAAFDRDSITDTGRLVDGILSFVEAEFDDHEDPDAAADDLAEEFSQ
ncbi:hypothetical protein [Halobacterium yunchengense]|uniref:hypothetical protein n=1 Tax=Halobacterium yunchengense TaxID=3108497 RepID=UPI0030080234